MIRPEDAAGPTTTRELLRSWSRRSATLCLNSADAADATLTSEVADPEPGAWQNAYVDSWRSLFEDQIACDVFFPIPGSTTTATTNSIGAHRCVLEARRFEPFLKADMKRNKAGKDEVCLQATFTNEEAEDLRQAIASCYGIEPKRPVASGNKFGTLDTTKAYVLHNFLRLYPDWKDPAFFTEALSLTKTDKYTLLSIILEHFENESQWSVRDLEHAVEASGGFSTATPPRIMKSDIRDILIEIGTYHRYQHKFELNKEGLLGQKHHAAPSTLRPLSPPDVKILASPGASPQENTVWSLEAYKACLCAHSDYFRSFLTHEGWSFETEAISSQKGGQSVRTERIIVRLDSDQFTEQTIRKLLSTGYGTVKHISGALVEELKDLIHAATYFVMKSSSLLFEESMAKLLTLDNVANMYQFADAHGAQCLQLICHAKILNNLGSLTGPNLAGLNKHHVTEILRSNPGPGGFALEDFYLEAMLKWVEETGATMDEAKELIQMVRLPFVPVGSPVMVNAVEKGLVGDDMMRVCRLFQTDKDHRASMIGCDTMHTPRLTPAVKQELRRFVNPPQPRPDFDFALMRMLGTVNGRNNFEKIKTIQMNEASNRLMCVFPDESMNTQFFDVDFPFATVTTENMPRNHDRLIEPVDRNLLETLDPDEVNKLLASMLKRENSLRLHPRVQTVLGSIGEDEQEMSLFTTALQAHVATEFNVDPAVGIELIRSASTLFPETAQLAHYVRHNRSFEGDLRVGMDAPDVKLFTMKGEPTTLWTAIDKRRCFGGVSDALKPVVILAASYT